MDPTCVELPLNFSNPLKIKVYTCTYINQFCIYINYVKRYISVYIGFLCCTLVCVYTDISQLDQDRI